MEKINWLRKRSSEGNISPKRLGTFQTNWRADFKQSYKAEWTARLCFSTRFWLLPDGAMSGAPPRVSPPQKNPAGFAAGFLIGLINYRPS
jgi:hypothetical protein